MRVARADVAGDQRVADPAGGNALAVEQDLRHRLGGDAVLGADGLEQGGIAGAALAEAEIVAGDDACGADLPAEDVGDEILGVFRGELAVELEHQHGVGAGMGEQSPGAGRAWSGGTAAGRA